MCHIYRPGRKVIEQSLSTAHETHLFTSISTKLLASLHIHTLCKITNFHTVSLDSVFKRHLSNNKINEKVNNTIDGVKKTYSIGH